MNAIRKGFTIVELLLYTAIASSVLTASSLFLSTLLASRVKNQVMAEVDQQGTQAMRFIAQSVRNAKAINAPSSGASGTLLSIDAPTAANTPTIFDVASGAIRIREGSGTSVPLTNGRVTVSNVAFENLSRTGTSGTIRIRFTVTYDNVSGRNEYSFSRMFVSSASLR